MDGYQYSTHAPATPPSTIYNLRAQFLISGSKQLLQRSPVGLPNPLPDPLQTLLARLKQEKAEGAVAVARGVLSISAAFARQRDPQPPRLHNRDYPRGKSLPSSPLSLWMSNLRPLAVPRVRLVQAPATQPTHSGSNRHGIKFVSCSIGEGHS